MEMASAILLKQMKTINQDLCSNIERRDNRIIELEGIIKNYEEKFTHLTATITDMNAIASKRNADIERLIKLSALQESRISKLEERFDALISVFRKIGQ